jgi:hypothetical protein
MRNLRINIMVLLMAFCIVLSYGTETKAENTAKFDVQIGVGFNDNYKVGYSTPVTLTIKNKYKNINGEVEIRVPSVPGKYMSYVKPLSMQKDSEKVITINVPVGANRSTYTVIINNGKEKAYEDTFSIGMTSNNMVNFIGILSDDFDSLSYMNKAPAPSGITLLTKVIKLDEKIFPEDIFTLNAFDVLVINDFDTSKFSKAQYEILKQWVNNGGTLLIGTGAKYAKNLGIFKDEFIQGTVKGVESIATSKIYRLATNGDNKNEAKVEVLFLGVKDSTVLMEDKNVKLVQSLSKGKGTVGIVAFDLGQAPFVNWSNNTAFVEKLLGLINPNMINMQKMNNSYPSSNIYSLRDIMSKFSEMDIAKTSSFYIILFIYVLVVAPLNYLVLKKMDKREFMWITVPAIAIIFGLGVYVSGSGTRLSKITTNMVSILNVDDKGNATSSSYAGIFNSNKMKLNIVGKNGQKILPVSDPYYNGQSNQPVSNEDMEAKIFAVENGGIEYRNSSILETKVLQIQQNSMNIGMVEANISMKNGNLVGNIKNSTKLDFYDCYIITPSAYYKIDELKSGQIGELGTSSGLNGGNIQQMIQDEFYKNNMITSNMNDSERKKYMDKIQEGSILQTMINNQNGVIDGIKMIAFSKTAIHSPLIINGNEAKKYERNILYIPLNLKFKNGDTIDYPLGLVHFDIINTSSLQFINFDNRFVGNGSAEMLYSIDENMSAEEIEINTVNNSNKQGPTKPNYYIFNIDKKAYEPLQDGVIKGDVLKKYLSKDNHIQIKLELKDCDCVVPQMAARGRVK